jgi:cytochrome c oxidase cbb3-type subunit IV
MSTYHTLANIAQTFGMLLFIGGFLLVVVYALLPRNRATFDAAARAPLHED